MVWHACSIHLFWDDWWRHNLYCVWIWPREKRTRVKRIYYPPQELIIDWILEIRHKWEPTYGTFCCNASHMLFPWFFLRTMWFKQSTAITRSLLVLDLSTLKQQVKYINGMVNQLQLPLYSYQPDLPFDVCLLLYSPGCADVCWSYCLTIYTGVPLLLAVLGCHSHI